MRGTRGSRRSGAAGILGVLLFAGVGCVHTGMPHESTPITVPPPGAVPVELNKITFPPYVIEAPDNLLIEVILRSPKLKRDEKGELILGPDGCHREFDALIAPRIAEHV